MYKRQVKRYSSGMYVKLAFSVAAHLDSEIMIMDVSQKSGIMSRAKVPEAVL